MDSERVQKLLRKKRPTVKDLAQIILLAWVERSSDEIKPTLYQPDVAGAITRAQTNARDAVERASLQISIDDAQKTAVRLHSLGFQFQALFYRTLFLLERVSHSCDKVLMRWATSDDNEPPRDYVSAREVEEWKNAADVLRGDIKALCVIRALFETLDSELEIGSARLLISLAEVENYLKRMKAQKDQLLDIAPKEAEKINQIFAEDLQSFVPTAEQMKKARANVKPRVFEWFDNVLGALDERFSKEKP